MAQRHRDRKQYFDEQAITTKKYVIPFIETHKRWDSNSRILEIGCGEGGNMKPFVEAGCDVVGIDLNPRQLQKARDFYSQLSELKSPRLIHENIYNISTDDIGRFDIIMLRDVIEHIPDQERFMKFVIGFLNNDGVIFFGFPPWYMPFGGHQQMCSTKMGKLPWMHLLPRNLYGKYLKLAGEKESVIESRLEIHDTQITIDRFFRIVRSSGYEFLKKQLYFINPNYEVKFNLKPRKVLPPLTLIPYLRNFYSTCCYALIKKKV